MRVFVTGANGWIGSAVVEELLGAGHQVVGLARSDAAATAIQTNGATATDPSPEFGPGASRGGSENLALSYVDHGVRTLITRFAPSVHGAGDWGFVNFLAAAAAREQGVSGYIDDGCAQWCAAHRSDTARLIRLGSERAPAGTRLHAVAEEAIDTRTIAEAIGEWRQLSVQSVPAADAGAHFGFVARFLATTMTASAAHTRMLLDWTPTGPALLQDILAGAYALN